MIDLHCHVLPGVDDGPATMPEAIDLVHGAAADGIRTIVATPHVDHSHRPVGSAHIRAAVPEVQARLDRAGVGVAIETGAEVAFTRAMELDDDELAALTLGRRGWLLLECPLAVTATPGFTSAARMLARRGHQVLLAHPERCPLFLRTPGELDHLVAEGMLAQVTARSLDGRFGRTVHDLALHLVARGTAHVVASDGHDKNRPAKIAAYLERAPVSSALADWLTYEVPAALLSGHEPPPRPRTSTGPARGRLSRLVSRLSGERPVKHR
jgi:protein-tyrosine phosphatase